MQYMLSATGSIQDVRGIAEDPDTAVGLFFACACSSSEYKCHNYIKSGPF